MSKYITDDVEVSLGEENFDKENSNKENCSKDNLMKKIKRLIKNKKRVQIR